MEKSHKFCSSDCLNFNRLLLSRFQQEEKMNPVVDEDMLLDILDTSLQIPAPLEIPDLSDFPDENKEVGFSGTIEGELLTEESESHDVLNGVELTASRSVKLEEMDGNEQLPEWLPSVIGMKEPFVAIKQEVVDEGTMVQPCLLPHCPVPLSFVSKEQRCPSQKRVCPNCDSHGRKAPRLGETQDKHLCQCETLSNIHKAVLVNDVNRIGEEPDDNASQEEIQQGNVLGRSDDVLEDLFESRKDTCVQMTMQVPLFRESSKIKDEEELVEDNNDEQGKGMEQSENNGEEITVPIMAQNKKKKSTGLSCRNIKMAERRNSVDENECVLVVVHGLMPEPNPNPPRRERKKAIKKSRPMVGVETKEGMKHGCAMRTKSKCSPEKSEARRTVRDTLRLFHGILRKLVQADEKKSKGRVDASIQISTALKIFKDNRKYINAKKMMGHVPGVEVGDLFNYRVELDIIGLHKPLQSGIDFVKLDDKLIAISVVASGRYDNIVENSDVLIYVGQGGNVAGGCKRFEDQKLQGGNLALKNSICKKNPVRVIRGFKERKTIRGKRVTIPTYIYDGLYTVERCWQECGPHGKMIYKFELKRGPHQPELTWKKLKKVKKSKESKTREGHTDDISHGKEETLICAVNTIDDEKPLPFNYITSVMYPGWCRPIPPKGCDCTDGCSDSKHCACALKNGGEIPYNYSGAIVEEKSLVYECGPSCNCPPTCHNRVSQHGIKLPLEIFKTESRGWGVRSLSPIPSGSFVCEYIGELFDEKEAKQRTDDNEYLFDIGQNYNDPTLRERLSTLMPNMPSSSSDVVESVGFVLDAGKFGNIGRFINHSCSPNLFAQNVLYDHEDKRIPHIMMFASENIPPLQELTYHCNYTIDQVFDSKGNIKRKSCLCGSSECIGWMY